ncbi:hypothetical protein CANCADRAFT_449 [Tortispora caseinolytica NRRL Y-17796]|uniref:NADPH:adrenodoxin oxidoreductase, mitochondrial n=1 Tax=Tortispora caseinolytica NRRL Y-17796 TaxID=767744 RepID=A0A1E4TJC6_9ASCO|nr:hypothetical protein CANCADRAFT_449 [Tortispora caseinolytica NRRL Y-17796]
MRVRIRAVKRVAGVRWHSVAIVGAGPSGFYLATRLLEKNPEVTVDMYEKLPVPFGLARFGVAPDHEDVKNCNERFQGAAETHSSRFRFIGNTEVGADISLKQLKDNYNSLVLSYGSSEDNRLNIPGEDLKGVISARSFIMWYNGYPDLEPPAGIEQLMKATNVAIIGAGNVALDVARMLLCDHEHHLKNTDVSSEALELLKKLKVKDVNVFARRGLFNSAFTTSELRPMMKLPGVQFRELEEDMILHELQRRDSLSRKDKRLLDVIMKGSDVEKARVSWALNYYRLPKEFLGDEHHHIKGMIFEVSKPAGDSENKKVVSTGITRAYNTQTAFRSIGYKTIPLPGMKENGIEFQPGKPCVPNKLGRVLNAKGTVIPGLYTAGWAASGPTGTIATTMMTSFSVAEEILEDLSHERHKKPGYEAVKPLLKNTQVSWEDWDTLKAYEEKEGRKKNKPREKVTSTRQMLEIMKLN